MDVSYQIESHYFIWAVAAHPLGISALISDQNRMKGTDFVLPVRIQWPSTPIGRHNSAGEIVSARACPERFRAFSTPTASSPKAFATARTVPTPQNGSKIAFAPT